MCRHRGVQRLIVAWSQLDVSKTRTFCRKGFMRHRWFGVWPCLAHVQRDERHHLCGRQTVQDWNPCGSSAGCGRSSVCLMIQGDIIRAYYYAYICIYIYICILVFCWKLGFKWFNSIVVHTLIFHRILRRIGPLSPMNVGGGILEFAGGGTLELAPGSFV